MASRSPEFLIVEENENEDLHEDSTESESLSIHQMNADLMLMLIGEDQDFGKVPFLSSDEGNA